MAGQIAQAGQVVRRREVVHERQRGRHAAREGLVGGVAQQRVEPDQAAGPAPVRKKNQVSGFKLGWIAFKSSIARFFQKLFGKGGD